MKTVIVRFLAFSVVFLSAIHNFAQSPKQAHCDSITREQGDRILEELREIRQLLKKDSSPNQGPQAVQRASVNISGMEILGRKDAPLTMVEFTDYQCPFCKSFHNAAFVELKKGWIDTGKLRFVSWDVPLEFHHQAANAAEASRCAGVQGKFWEMRALLIANATKLSEEDIVGYGRQLNLNTDQFSACTQGHRFLAEIKKSVNTASSAGVLGTPAFLIGRTNGDVVEGAITAGAQPFSVFEAILKQELEKATK